MLKETINGVEVHWFKNQDQDYAQKILSVLRIILSLLKEAPAIPIHHGYSMLIAARQYTIVLNRDGYWENGVSETLPLYKVLEWVVEKVRRKPFLHEKIEDLRSTLEANPYWSEFFTDHGTYDVFRSAFGMYSSDPAVREADKAWREKLKREEEEDRIWKRLSRREGR